MHLVIQALPASPDRRPVHRLKRLQGTPLYLFYDKHVLQFLGAIFRFLLPRDICPRSHRHLQLPEPHHGPQRCRYVDRIVPDIIGDRVTGMLNILIPLSFTAVFSSTAGRPSVRRRACVCLLLSMGLSQLHCSHFSQLRRRQ